MCTFSLLLCKLFDYGCIFLVHEGNYVAFVLRQLLLIVLSVHCPLLHNWLVCIEGQLCNLCLAIGLLLCCWHVGKHVNEKGITRDTSVQSSISETSYECFTLMFCNCLCVFLWLLSMFLSCQLVLDESTSSPISGWFIDVHVSLCHGRMVFTDRG